MRKDYINYILKCHARILRAIQRLADHKIIKQTHHLRIQQQGAHRTLFLSMHYLNQFRRVCPLKGSELDAHAPVFKQFILVQQQETTGHCSCFLRHVY